MITAYLPLKDRDIFEEDVLAQDGNEVESIIMPAKISINHRFPICALLLFMFSPPKQFYYKKVT